MGYVIEDDSKMTPKPTKDGASDPSVVGTPVMMSAASEGPGGDVGDLVKTLVDTQTSERDFLRNLVNSQKEQLQNKKEKIAKLKQKVKQLKSEGDQAKQTLISKQQQEIRELRDKVEVLER